MYQKFLNFCLNNSIKTTSNSNITTILGVFYVDISQF